MKTLLWILALLFGLAACGGSPTPELEPTVELPAAYKERWNATGTLSREGSTVSMRGTFVALVDEDQFLTFIDELRFRPVGEGRMSATCDGTACFVTAWPSGVVFVTLPPLGTRFGPAKAGLTVVVDGSYEAAP